MRPPPGRTYRLLEQKLCSNTGSFTVPRYIDGSTVHVKDVQSHADFVTSYSAIAERNGKNFSDIKELYSGITEEDKASLTLFQTEDKFAYLVGKKRKEATQQERRQLAQQFLEANNQAEVKSWFDNVFKLVDMRKLRIRNFVTVRTLHCSHYFIYFTDITDCRFGRCGSTPTEFSGLVFYFVTK